MDTLYESDLYKSIKSLCDENGIKPGKMCVDLEISKSMMSKLKDGSKKDIETGTAVKIAEYFGVSVDRVIGVAEKEKSPASEDVGLDEELIRRLCMLTPEEVQRVDAFVQGILASR